MMKRFSFNPTYIPGLCGGGFTNIQLKNRNAIRIGKNMLPLSLHHDRLSRPKVNMVLPIQMR